LDLAASRKRKTVILSAVLGVAVLIAAGAAAGARYLAIHNPWSNADELALADITMDPPTITLAKAQPAEEELLDYPMAPGHPGHASRPERTSHPERVSSARGTQKSPGKVVPAASKPSHDAEGLEIGEADQSAIQSVVAAHQKSLYPCLVAEARRKPGLFARIPIEFAIGNDGKVAKLWIDNPDYKTGPLPECMLKVLQKWPFKPSGSAGATVGLSFTLGKKSG
jgi:hypothetical protein